MSLILWHIEWSGQSDVTLETCLCQVIPNTSVFIDTSKEVGLEVNAEKTKYMLVSRDQNAGQRFDIKIANRCFKMCQRFKY
jgi:hypothetical protein